MARLTACAPQTAAAHCDGVGAGVVLVLHQSVFELVSEERVDHGGIDAGAAHALDLQAEQPFPVRRLAAEQRVVHGGDELVDAHVAVGVGVADAGRRGRGAVGAAPHAEDRAAAVEQRLVDRDDDGQTVGALELVGGRRAVRFGHQLSDQRVDVASSSCGQPAASKVRLAAAPATMRAVRWKPLRLKKNGSLRRPAKTRSLPSLGRQARGGCWRRR